MTSTQPTRIPCSSTIFKMYYATPAQPKIVIAVIDKIIQRYTQST